MELVVEIVGIKAFKGTIDGKVIDSASLFGVVRLDSRFNRRDESGTNWKTGFALEEWKLPGSEIAMRMMHLNPSIKNPISVKLEIERVSNGKESTEVIIDAFPLNKSIVDQETGEIKLPQAQHQKKAA